MNQAIKDMHKMRKVTVYRAKSRELLLGFKLGAFHDRDIQRPLRRQRDASGDYTMVVYAQAYAYNIHGHDDYSVVRLTSGTAGRKEEYEITREVFRNMVRDIQAEIGPDEIDYLELPVGVTNLLKANDIYSITHLLEYTSREVQKLPGIGKKNMEHIVYCLHKQKLKLNPY